MLQDLAAIAPTVIVGVAFLVGVALLLRHELAPKRRAGSAAERGGAWPDDPGPDEGSGPVAREAEEDERELGGPSET
jgi:hypothetical protein